MKQKIVSSLAIIALVFSHGGFAFAQTLDATVDTPQEETTPSAETSVESSVTEPDASSSEDTVAAEAEVDTPIASVCVGATIDSDGDGICDEAEGAPAEAEPTSPSEPTQETDTVTEPLSDTDHDGTPNYLDPDDDGDGIPTATEDTTASGEQAIVDSDGDTVPDYLEPNTTDTDADGITNNLDPDDDGDTVPTINDGTVTDDPVHEIDTDGDGTTNVADTDDDGDTVPTIDEVITDTSDTDAAVDEAVDTDHDGIINALDPDDDNDGIPTAEEDTNNDGTVLDDDADGDTIPDFEESNTTDTDNDGLTDNTDSDDDGDGVPTEVETHVEPVVSSSGGGGYYYVPPLDTDNDGTPDYLDTDDDNDKVETKDEQGDTDADSLPDYVESGTRDLDGDGKVDSADNEDDGDGILSKLDSNPYTDSCYAPGELGYRVYVVGPDSTIYTTAKATKKTVLASDVIRYDFELGTDNDFNDLAVRVNDEGHRSFVVTVMNAEVGQGYIVHLRVLGDGETEKDLSLFTNPAASVNVPQRIPVNQHVTICVNSENFCRAHITEYMRMGADNDPVEVSKLQSFLVEREGFTALTVSGVFDAVTDAAVRAFQEEHAGIVLGPWGIQNGTGYVYRTTTKRINDLYCTNQ